jgi:uncharacterized OB-fold protein
VSIAIFLLLAAAVAVALIYPLIPSRRYAQAVPQVTDREIDAAVRKVRRARAGNGPRCAACGHVYKPGDRFCVRCGEALPQVGPSGPVCPECGEPVQEGDSFCPKCGHRRPVGEAA